MKMLFVKLKYCINKGIVVKVAMKVEQRGCAVLCCTVRVCCAVLYSEQVYSIQVYATNGVLSWIPHNAGLNFMINSF